MKPISPRHVANLNEDGLVLAMVPYALEEDSTSKQRDLYRLNVDPYSEFTPGIGSKAIRDKSREKAIEVEEEPVDKLHEVSLTVIQGTN